MAILNGHSDINEKSSFAECNSLSTAQHACTCEAVHTQDKEVSTSPIGLQIICVVMSAQVRSNSKEVNTSPIGLQIICVVMSSNVRSNVGNFKCGRNSCSNSHRFAESMIASNVAKITILCIQSKDSSATCIKFMLHTGLWSLLHHLLMSMKACGLLRHFPLLTS